jgi:hydrogenase expression/formation protein HypC
MCVAMPGTVVSIDAPSTGAVWSQVEFGDRVLKVNLVMLPDVNIGDHVLVHSGYAIRTVSPQVVAEVSFDRPHDHVDGSRSP